MGVKGVGSGKDEWGTPRYLFEELDREFNFTLDPCGWRERRLKPGMITLDVRNGGDGLVCDWTGHRVFVNPPYSEHKITEWVKKAFLYKNSAEVIVMLIPPNTATKCFHDFIYHIAEIRFLRGRVAFIDRDTGRKENSNTQGSMIVIYRKERHG